jgi:uncharacterized protein YkwD
VTISVGRSRRHLALVFLLAAALLVSGIAIDRTRAGAATTRRGEMLQLTNEDRADKDRKALELDAKLSRYAKRHARAMAEAGEIFHTGNLAAKLKGRNWTIGGENVGIGPTLPDLEGTFMGSKPHRRNILRAGFDHVAIGVVLSDGNFWVTVIFYG